MTKVKIDYSEKRKETRFPINSTVTITVEGSKSPIIGTCSNISGSGLLIRTNKAIDANKKILIDITEGKIDFSAEALVIRCEQDGDVFYIGIQVTNQLK